MICEHNSTPIFLFSSNDYISCKQYNVLACRICGMAYTEIGGSPVNNESHYPPDYYGEQSRYPIFISWLAGYLAKKRTKLLPELPNTGKMIDIGCGQGWFVKQFSDIGWQAQGIEVSEVAAHHAAKRLGLDILIGENIVDSLEDNQFDVIGLWHVLEHVENPKYLLKQIERILKQDGIVLIGVPNFGSFEAKFGKAGWFHLDVPRHLFHFDASNLSELLKKAGLKITEKKYFVPEYDFFSFIQTAQNFLGLEMNLLYKTLRKGDLNVMSRKPSFWQWLSLIVTTPLLAMLSLFYVPIAILSRNGSSLILIVEKNAQQ